MHWLTDLPATAARPVAASTLTPSPCPCLACLPVVWVHLPPVQLTLVAVMRLVTSCCCCCLLLCQQPLACTCLQPKAEQQHHHHGVLWRGVRTLERQACGLNTTTQDSLSCMQTAAVACKHMQLCSYVLLAV